MERKRFRFDISNNNIEALLAKRRKKFGHLKPRGDNNNTCTSDDSKPGRNSDHTSIRHVQSIPSDMVIQPKTRKDCVPRDEYENPEHWVKPEKIIKPSREVVMQAERDSISKMIDRRESWSRGARCLVYAGATPKCRKPSGITKIGPIKRSAPVE